MTVYSPDTGLRSHTSKCRVEYALFTELNLRRHTRGDNSQIRNGLGVFIDSPGFTLIKS